MMCQNCYYYILGKCDLKKEYTDPDGHCRDYEYDKILKNKI